MAEKSSSIVVGTQQSPIDIRHADTLFVPELAGSLDIKYLSATAVGYVDPSSHNFLLRDNQHLMLSFRGISYELKKIHFHKVCEHTINGKAPTHHEMHLVHQRTDSTDYCAIAVFFDVSRTAKHRPSLYRWSQTAGGIGADKKTRVVKGVAECVEPEWFEIELADILPSLSSEWYHYQGSLTTHPFSEDVAWIIDRSATTVKQLDIDELAKAEQDRRVGSPMPLNRRFVLRNTGAKTGRKK